MKGEYADGAFCLDGSCHLNVAKSPIAWHWQLLLLGCLQQLSISVKPLRKMLDKISRC